MSKRKRSISQPISNYNIPDIFPQNLRNKIKFKTTEHKGHVSNNEIYNDLNKSINSLNPTQQELANFIFNKLGQNENFKGLNLYNEEPKEGGSEGYYNMHPSDREMTLFRSYKGKTNPLLTMIHEGTHFLDDEYMRNYQKPAFTFLNKHQGNVSIKDDKGNWYTHAQNILNPKGHFKQAYPFKELKAEDGPNSLKLHYNRIYEANDKPIPDNDNLNYSTLYNALNESGVEGQIFSPLSEFTTFGIENLHTPWNINWKKIKDISNVQGPNQSDLGRKFLKKMTKATYTGFRDIYNQQPNQGQSFMDAYPAMHKSFVDRLSDLRNVNKYPTQPDYENRLNAPGRMLNPQQIGYNQPSSSSSALSSSSSSSASSSSTNPPMTSSTLPSSNSGQWSTTYPGTGTKLIFKYTP